MHKFALYVAVGLLLAGCSHSHQPLEISKKKRLATELIASSTKCDAYREKLASPSVDDDGVDDIFHEALHAHCIKKDI